MDTNCPVAQFVRERIQVTGKAQQDIAREVGFEKPNMITHIKQGRTKLPLAKICLMAVALESDPLALMKLCLSTYYPDNWEALEPMFETALTADELVMLKAWRHFVGTPYPAVLTDEQRKHLNAFLLSLRPTSTMQ